MINLKSLNEHINEASSAFKHAVQQAIQAAGYNLKQSEVKVGAKKVRGMGTKITLNGEMIGFDDNIPEMIASFTKSIEEDPEKYGLKESINEAVPSVEDYHTKDKRDILFTIEGPHKKSLQTSRAIYKDVEKHGIIFDEFFDNDKGNESGKFLISFPASVNNVQGAGKKEIIKLVGNRGTLVERPNWVKESVNEADQMHGEYLMQMLKAQADDIKRDEPKTAAALMYLWDRIHQSARDKDIDIEYVQDFLNEPRGRKHSQNLPEWMITDLFVESFIMKEDAASFFDHVNEDFYRIPQKIAASELYELTQLIKSVNDKLSTGQDVDPKDLDRAEKLLSTVKKSAKKFKTKEEVEGTIYEGEILVWEEMEKPFEDLKNALDKIGKENTDPKWSKGILNIWNMIEKAEDKLNLYDKMYGAIPIKESVNEAIKSKGKSIKKGDKFYDTYGDAFTVTQVSSNKIKLMDDGAGTTDGTGYTFPDDFDSDDFDSWFVKESVNEKKVPPNDETIKFHIDSYRVDDDPYDVAKEIGSKYNWTEREIEKAEKILRKKYLK